MEENEVDALVGANVQRLRQAAGMSQTELAQRLEEDLGRGFQQQTVLKVEKGTRPLKVTEAAAVARILRCSVETLLKRSSDAEDRLLVDLLVVQQEQIEAAREAARLRHQIADLTKRLEEAEQRHQACSTRWAELSQAITEQRERDERARRG